MKITGIRTRVFEWAGKTLTPQANFCTTAGDLLDETGDTLSSFRFHGWLVVEIETDAGVVGIGNAALAPRLTKYAIDLYLKPLLLGENLFDYEYLWQKMYRRTLPFGRKGVGMVAISAVDIAIWDAIGKALKLPVFRLLGGRTKRRIPVYASKLYSQPLAELAKEAQSYKDQGFSAMKLRFGWGPNDGAAGMRKNVDLVRSVREVVGDEIDVMADAYMGWTVDYTRRIMPMLQPSGLRWLEEPVVADDIGGYAELRALSQIPIAGGEHEFTLAGIRQLIEARAVDVIQFDTNRVGGITQAAKILALAEAFGVPVIPHAGQMHNYHVVMASVNAPMAEYFPRSPVEVGNELFWYLFKGEPEAQNGYIELEDDVPGLGLELNQESLGSFRTIE